MMPSDPVGDQTKYPNPPILEALCEIHFDRSLGDESVRSKLQEKWSKDYPDQRLIDEQNVEFQLGPDGVNVAQQPLGKRLIARSADGLNLAQLTANFLVVNRLRPYPGWNEFFLRNILERAADVSATVSGVHIRRLGLRYINRIVIPQHPFVWEDWFQTSLPIPDKIPSESMQFQLEFHRRIGGEERMVTKLVTADPSAPGTTSIILDLDVIWEGKAVVSMDHLAEMLERVHRPHRLAFESYLTDKVRSLFY